MREQLNVRNVVIAALLTMLALLPVYAWLIGSSFLVSLFTRILILAIAATSLNLLIGFGGMVSFGHAVYLGVGGYAVYLAKEGITSGFVQCPRPAVSACCACARRAHLRTARLFIMITLSSRR